MRNTLFALIFLISLIAIASYYIYKNQEIPSKIAKYTPTVLNVDTLRFTFKSSKLIQQGFATYNYALQTQDEDILYEALDFYEASIAFMNISYSMDKELKNFAEPLIEESIDIIEHNSLTINNETLQRLRMLTNLISNKAEEIEKETWDSIRNKYIQRQTATLKNNLYREVTILLGALFFIGLLFLFLNILKQRKQLYEANKKLNLAATVFASANEGIIITDKDSVIMDVNDAFTTLTGYTKEEVVGEKTNILKSGIQDESFYETMWHKLLKEKSWSGELWNKDKSGKLYAEFLNISIVQSKDGEIERFIGLFSDITEIKSHQKHLESLVHYDSLTSLPNRVLLSDRIEQAMKRVRRNRTKLYITYIDLDGFKEINDLYGNEVGDILLQKVSKKLQYICREEDTIARIGSDEFVLVHESKREPTRLINKLLEGISDGFTIDKHSLHITASIGISIYPQKDQVNQDQLIRQADLAMYDAKRSGKNKYHFFDLQQDSSIREKYEKVDLIQDAYQKNQFKMHYQPKVDIYDGNIIGFEALIRWDDPIKGLIGPDDFLPYIQNDPFEIELGKWIITSVFQQINKWHQLGYEIHVSINITGEQLLQKNFLPWLEKTKKQFSDLSASNIEFEILESNAIEDHIKVQKVINEAKNIGFKFSIDDFGTGYSSLNYLKNLPVDTVKIDRSFIRNMLTDPKDFALVEGTIKLSEVFKRAVIAEGVETQEHAKMLLQLGCKNIQGYFIAKALEADSVLQWIEGWTKNPLALHIDPLSKEELELLYTTIK